MATAPISPAESFAQGDAAAQAFNDNMRKNMAYNALAKVYGPGAGAVQEMAAALAAKQAEAANTQAEADTRKALLPGVGEAQSAETGLKQAQASDMSAQAKQRADMLRFQGQAAIAGLVAQSDDPLKALDTYQPLLGSLGVSDQDYAAVRAAIAADPAHATAIYEALNRRAYPNQYLMTGAAKVGTDANGNSVLIGQTKGGAPIVTALPGVTPTQVTTSQTGQTNSTTRQKSQAETARHNVANEGLGAQRNAIAAAQAQTGAYRAGTAANNSQFGAAPGTSLPGGGAAQAPSGSAQAAAPSPTAGTLFDRLPPKGKQIAIGQAQNIVNQQTVLQSSNAIMDQVEKQISPFTSGPGAVLRWAPGTRPKDLEANLQTLKTQGLMTWLQSMKNAQGNTGIGRVLQSEANAAMTLYGNMEQDQSPSQLRYHLQLFRQSVNKLSATAQQGFKAQYGVDAQTALGGPAPAQQPLPGGFKYLGKVQ